MLKKITFVFLILISNSIYSQGYFDGNELHCPTENKEAKRLFDSGIKIMHMNYNLTPKYLAANAEIFAQAILQDTTFCDGYFFAGYILNLQNQYRESFAFHKVADLKSPRPILIYKINLAAISMKVEMYQDARDAYQEIVKYFPENPEGYYGIAATSPMIGDYKIGLENVIKAGNMYTDKEQLNQCQFIKGILFSLDGQYAEAKTTLEEVNGKYKRDLNFNIYYSLALLKLSKLNNDEEMKKKAKKFYDKVDDKRYIPTNLIPEFIF